MLHGRTDGGDQQSKPNCSVSRLWVARSRVCVYGVQLSYIGSTPRSRSTSSSKSRFVTISRVPRNKQKKKPAHFFPPCGSCSQPLERKHVTIGNDIVRPEDDDIFSGGIFFAEIFSSLCVTFCVGLIEATRELFKPYDVKICNYLQTESVCYNCAKKLLFESHNEGN